MEIVSLKDFLDGDGRDATGGMAGGVAKAEGHIAKYKISDLKPALHEQNRVNVFVNGEYDFSLDIAQVVELGVKLGREISAEELAELRANSEFGKIYQRSLEWVLVRPRSAQETRDYLKRIAHKRGLENKLRKENQSRSAEDRKKYHLKTKILPEISLELCQKVMERLTERGYLDDVKFAKFYVENRFVKKGTSRRRLELELQKKGVSSEDIAQAFADVPRDDEEEIRKIIAKKGQKYDKNKLIQYLMRQGFDYQLVQNLVAREMDSQSWE